MRHLIILASLLLIVSSADAQMKDFIPLTVGVENHFSYFREHAWYKDPIYGPESHDDYWKDSGTVAYKFLSSSIHNDTTTTWIVRETFQVSSIEWHLDSLGIRDTTLSQTNDTTDYTLYEYTTGYHKLFINTRVLKLYGEVYRFSDQDADTVEYVFTDNGYPILYTFVRDIGLVRIFKESSFIGNFSYDKYRREVELLYTTSISTVINPIHSFYLSQNYPNPFNNSVLIKYSLPGAVDATLKIYDLLGREVALLVNERKLAGEYTVSWDAKGVPSGVYFYRIVAGEFTQTKKMVVLK